MYVISICMYVMYACMYTLPREPMHACMYVCLCLYVCVCYKYMYVMHACMCTVEDRVLESMHVYVCICMYLRVQACMHVNNAYSRA